MKLALIAGILALLGGVVKAVSNVFIDYIPQSIFNAIFVAVALIVFALYVKKELEKASTDEAPSTLIILVEFFLEKVNGLVKATMGENNMKFAPYIFSLFIFLICSNLLGLIGLDSPTGNYSVTLALALVTFGMSQFYGVKTSGFGGYLKSFFEPFPLLSPLNIMGELANPVSLSFRLFGNILSGGLIMTLVNAAFGWLTILLAPPLQIYFDIFSGILQAFIFTMLTMVFVAGKIND